jgi:hypothetical protein
MFGSGIKKCLDPDPGLKNAWIQTQDEKMVGSGYGIKHPRSATLVKMNIIVCAILAVGLYTVFLAVFWFGFL